VDIYSGGNCPKCGGVLKDVFIVIEYEEAIERVCTNCRYTFDQRPLDWVDIKEKKIRSIGETNDQGGSKKTLQVLQGKEGEGLPGAQDVRSEEVHVPHVQPKI